MAYRCHLPDRAVQALIRIVSENLWPTISLDGHNQNNLEGSAFMGLTYHFVTGVDIEGFSRLNTSQQLRTQMDLDQILSAAASQAGLDRTRWYRQLAGDGELAVLPADTDGLGLLDSYPRELSRLLAVANTSRRPRLRIRVAVHHGALIEGVFGPVGQAPIVVARLLDAEPLREKLVKETALDLVLAVSATVYDEVVRSHLGHLDPAAYERTRIIAKGIDYPAYIYCEQSRTEIGAIVPEATGADWIHAGYEESVAG